MESFRYYEFINTVDLAEIAPATYHFYGVFKGIVVYGAHTEDQGLSFLSSYLKEQDEETLNDIKEIIEKKIEELKEEEKL